jgi:hypothetical protein
MMRRRKTHQCRLRYSSLALLQLAWLDTANTPLFIVQAEIESAAFFADIAAIPDTPELAEMKKLSQLALSGKGGWIQKRCRYSKLFVPCLTLLFVNADVSKQPKFQSMAHMRVTCEKLFCVKHTITMTKQCITCMNQSEPYRAMQEEKEM